MFSTTKKRFLALGLLLTLAAGLSALPSITDFLTDEERAQLNDTGEITLFHSDDTEPQLMPDVGLARVLQDRLDKLEGNFSIEGLFFIPGDNRGNEQEELLNILNILTGISTLEGIEYYSVSKKKMRVLFEESWRIESLKRDAPTEDLHYTSLPDESEFYVRQNDSLFGVSKSQVRILASEDNLAMTLENKTDMKINNLIKVINKESFLTLSMVVPLEEGVLYYCNISAKMAHLSLIEKRASKSLYNRLVALYTWFERSYDEEG